MKQRTRDELLRRLKNQAARLSRLLELKSPLAIILREISIITSTGLALDGNTSIITKGISERLLQAYLLKARLCLYCEERPIAEPETEAGRDSSCFACYEDHRQEFGDDESPAGTL